jgi:hypothetical protein
MRHRFRRPRQATEEVRELARRVVRLVSRGLVMYETVAAQNIRTVWRTMVVTKAGALALLNTYERHVRQFWCFAHLQEVGETAGGAARRIPCPNRRGLAP